MAKMGRPVVDVPKDSTIAIRITKSQSEGIRKYAKDHKLTISQTLLNGYTLLQEKDLKDIPTASEREGENVRGKKGQQRKNTAGRRNPAEK